MKIVPVEKEITKFFGERLNQRLGIPLYLFVGFQGNLPAMPDDKYSDQETEQRVQRALKGAFKGSPTQLKDVPRKPRASRAKSAIRKTRKSA